MNICSIVPLTFRGQVKSSPEKSTHVCKYIHTAVILEKNISVKDKKEAPRPEFIISNSACGMCVVLYDVAVN